MSNFCENILLGDGKISVLELKNALNSIDDERSDDEIKEMINKADPSVDGNTEISYSEFMGVMAEADFYFLFKGNFNLNQPHILEIVNFIEKFLCTNIAFHLQIHFPVSIKIRLVSFRPASSTKYYMASAI